jgi:hypothetical protein
MVASMQSPFVNSRGMTTAGFSTTPSALKGSVTAAAVPVKTPEYRFKADCWRQRSEVVVLDVLDVDCVVRPMMRSQKLAMGGYAARASNLLRTLGWQPPQSSYCKPLLGLS